VELVDTSAWAKKEHHAIRDWFSAALVNGELAVCDAVVLEILQGATSPGLLAQLNDMLEAVPWFHMDAHEWTRAREVYDLLDAVFGTHMRCSVKLPDLLIAACAERQGLTIAHYDHDYETIAAVTHQPTR
jgi:predicted nucleic acid-binding protein